MIDGLCSHWIVDWQERAANDENTDFPHSFQRLRLLTSQLAPIHSRPAAKMQPLSTFVAFIALTVPTVTAHTPINGVMYSQPSRGLLQHSLCLDGEGCMSLHAFESTDDAVHRALAVMHTKTNKTESTHLSKLASTPNSRSTHGIICTGPMQTYCYHYRRLEATDEDEDDDEEVQEQIQQAQEAKKLKCERHLWGFVCEE